MVWGRGRGGGVIAMEGFRKWHTCSQSENNHPCSLQVPSVGGGQRNVFVQRPEVRRLAGRDDYEPDACAVHDTQTQRRTLAQHAQLITHQVWKTYL